MASLRRLILPLCAVFALTVAFGCGKKAEPTKGGGGPPEGYKGSQAGPPGGIQLSPTKR